MAQMNLFGEVESVGMTIEDAAERVSVSPATIRNWIKTGYVRQVGRGVVDEESVSRFMQDVAGRDKLNLRANKSRKDGHDHDVLSDELKRQLDSANVDVHRLGGDYENRLSESHRNQEGIYYTPMEVVRDMFVLDSKTDVSGMMFCDPCCGSGNFVMRAIELGFRPENIFGFDTDPNAVAITRRRILEGTGYESGNIVVGDFLSISVRQPRKFDFIHTNPPWGKKLPKGTREQCATVFGAGKSQDTCALFFFACLMSLKEGGQLGLLLPEAFFNISTYSSARAKALDRKVERLTDYGKPFKGLLTRAQAIILTNREASETDTVTCAYDGRTFGRTVDSFANNPKVIFNLGCDAESAAVIEHVYSLPHITLSERADWGLGIVTGNNGRFAKKEPENGLMPVFKGSDITENGLKAPSAFIPTDLSLYQQVAPRNLYEAEEKLIYRFISSHLCFFHDTEQRYILNSANMLIPKRDFPISAEQLCDLLNSRLMDWLFRNIFNTHKVLRGDLESLPIHVGYFEENSKFDEAAYLRYLKLEPTADGAFRIEG